MIKSTLAKLYSCVVQARTQGYQKNILSSHKLDKPVVVVGNITAGGTGKTPFVDFLVKSFQKDKLNPGIISRGYNCLLYTSPSPRDQRGSRMPSSA